MTHDEHKIVQINLIHLRASRKYDWNINKKLNQA